MIDWNNKIKLFFCKKNTNSDFYFFLRKMFKNFAYTNMMLKRLVLLIQGSIDKEFDIFKPYFFGENKTFNH